MSQSHCNCGQPNCTFLNASCHSQHLHSNLNHTPYYHDPHSHGSYFIPNSYQHTTRPQLHQPDSTTSYAEFIWITSFTSFTTITFNDTTSHHSHYLQTHSMPSHSMLSHQHDGYTDNTTCHRQPVSDLNFNNTNQKTKITEIQIYKVSGLWITNINMWWS
eukprot:423981_1